MNADVDIRGMRQSGGIWAAILASRVNRKGMRNSKNRGGEKF